MTLLSMVMEDRTHSQNLDLGMCFEGPSRPVSFAAFFKLRWVTSRSK